MKIGVIGAGSMGQMHARILTNLGSVQVAGVAAKSTGRSKSLAAELGIRCYATVQEMLTDPQVELVDICAPTNQHADLAIAAMEAGKQVILEFPVCCTAAELNAIHQASQRLRQNCAVAYYTRFQSQYRHIFELAQSGGIGGIQGLSIIRRSQAYFQSADIVNDLLSQDIDFMVRLLGLPRAIAHRRVQANHAFLAFDYGHFQATIEGCTDMHPGYPFSTRHFIAGSAGSLDLAWQFTDQPESLLRRNGRDGQEPVVVADFDPYAAELAYISEQILSNPGDSLFSLDSVLDSANLSYQCR